jgi:pimeloyl-ACP methyl ester carboxylesterase
VLLVTSARTVSSCFAAESSPRLGQSRGAAVARLPLAQLPDVAAPVCISPGTLVNAGRVPAIVEAKKLSVSPQGVLVQAERYAKGIHQAPRYQGEYGVPFLYATNGEVTWFHDVRDEFNRSRRVSGFHTPTALREKGGTSCRSLRQ